MENRAMRRAKARGKTHVPQQNHLLPAKQKADAPKVERHGNQPLQVNELYWPNMNYGHAGILRRAAGFDFPVDAVIQHGVDFEPERVYPGEALAPVCVAWSWSELRDDAWLRHKPVIKGCSPFLYLLEETGFTRREDAAGTLYAPMHGTTGVKVEGKNYYYKLARSLKELPQPVIATLYYNEFNDLDIRRQFEKNGIETICTVTDVNSEDALRNQLEAFSRVRYAASNDIGTNALYATILGIPYFLFGEPPTWTYAVDPGMADNFAPTKEARKVWAECAEPFQDFSETVTPERMEMAEYHLGAKRKLAKDELYEALAFASSLRWPL